MSDGLHLDLGPLRTALRRARDEIRDAVLREATDAAQQLATTLQTTYPRVTGDLVRGVRVQTLRDGGARVRSTAPHTHFLEYGTRPRVNYTRRGANRGSMPETPIFVPAAVAERAAFTRAAQAVLDRDRELV